MTKFIVWSKDGCPQCDQAKMLLNQRNDEYEERNISRGPYTREDLLALVPHARTVPQIFINDISLGSLQELKNYYREKDNANQ